MMIRILKAGVFCLVAAAVAGAPLRLVAQTNQNPPAPTQAAADKKAAPAKKRANGPFRGKLAAVDKVAKTITVGKRTFHITPQTKLLKAGAPATLDDAVVGERVTGGFKTADGGQLNATKVTFGPKAEDPAAKKADAKGGN
ncbi:MAG: hypothetical protein ACLQVX_11160 [Limisphaerales bacterium]